MKNTWMPQVLEATVLDSLVRNPAQTTYQANPNLQQCLRLPDLLSVSLCMRVCVRIGSVSLILIQVQDV